MICKRCFRMSDDGFEYCPYCGQSFSDDSKIEVKNDEGFGVMRGDEPQESSEAPHNEGAPQTPGTIQNNDPLHRPDGVPQGTWQYPYGYTTPPPMATPYPYYMMPKREPSPAGKFFSAIGHALLYLLLFFVCQALVSTIYTTAVGFRVTMSIMDDYLDDPYISDEQYDELLEKAQQALLDEIDSGDYAFISIISAVLTILIVFLVSVVKHRPFSEHVGFYPLHSRCALLLIPIGISAQFLLSMIINIIPWPMEVVDSFNELYSFMGESTNLFAAAAEFLSVVLFAPLAEEMIFRGCVYTRLRRGMPIAVAVILSALAFGLAHGALIAVFYATLLGLLLAYIYEKFGSMLAPFLLHLGFNLANYIPLMREDSSQLEIIITLVVSAVVFVICLSVVILSDVGKRDHGDKGANIPPANIPPVM